MKPKLLLLGSTGQLGSLVANQLVQQEAVRCLVTARDPSKIQELSKKYGEAVFLDLNDPESFPEALIGIDRLFLLTGYSFSMVTESKNILDAAKKAGVKHVVHLGVFSRVLDCTVPHFGWHQMIEAYIQHLGFKWTNLHPNCFLQNLINFSLVKQGKMRWYAQDTPCGWVALEDVAKAAAKILSEGPAQHHGRDYWFSTEALNVTQICKILTDETGYKFQPDPQPSDQFLKDMGADTKTLDPYFYSVAESFKQVVNGKAGYIGDVKDDMQILLGRKGLSVKEWTHLHKSKWASLADQTAAMHWGSST